MTASGRHLAVPILLEHIAAGITAVYPFPGAPAVSMRIDGSQSRLTLRARTSGPATLPSNPLKHVTVASTVTDGEHALEVSIAGSELVLDGHAMLCAIADRIQLDGQQPTSAVAETLARWRSVLALRTRMTLEAEIGLFGELLVLEALLDVSGAAALESWRGSLGEEHDFGLADVDVEVKTTSSDRREHWISGLRQLVPTAERPLVLLSIQLTRGGTAGSTLTAQIQTVRTKCGFPTLDEKLERAGWSDETSDLFVERWRLRAPATPYLVDDSFPALTPKTLGEIARDMSRVRDASYRLELTDLASSDANSSELASVVSVLDKRFTQTQ
jgi:hypothetical protein